MSPTQTITESTNHFQFINKISKMSRSDNVSSADFTIFPFIRVESIVTYLFNEMIKDTIDTTILTNVLLTESKV